MVLPSTHDATCVDLGVITHLCGGEGLALKVGDPITDLVVTRRDETSPLVVKDVADVKFCAESIAMFR